jgi:hypothetical protein
MLGLLYEGSQVLTDTNTFWTVWRMAAFSAMLCPSDACALGGAHLLRVQLLLQPVLQVLQLQLADLQQLDA